MGLISAVGGWVSARTLSGSGGSRGVFPLSPAQRLCSHDLLEKCIRQASRERLSPPAAAGGHRGVWRVLGHQVRDWCLPGPTLHTPGLFPVEHAPWADVAWSDGATPNGPRALGCLGV